MTPLTRAEVNALICDWRDNIEPNMSLIRRSQDDLLMAVGEENIGYTLTLMTSILAKGGIVVSNTNETKIGTVGVAVTGGTITGNVYGTAQTNNVPSQKEALQGLARLKASLITSPELDAEQKEEAASAVEDLEGEAGKGEDAKGTGRVRNALRTLTTIIGLAKGAEFLYNDVLPHLETLFHVAK